MNMTYLERLMYSTVRIECTSSSGLVSVGTGFYYQDQVEDSFMSVILTNKHVVDGMEKAVFRICLGDADGAPNDRSHHDIIINDLQAFVGGHPDADVDLCAINLAPIIESAHAQKLDLYIIPLEPSMVLAGDDLKRLNVMEPIVMVGYPNGLWDALNNKPIFRRGTTATHPAIDYTGRKEFLIDCACFPGSSGSPVLIVEHKDSGKLGSGDLAGNTYLLGLLYAGPQYNVRGEIDVVDVPTVATPIVNTNLMLNLGIVIKAERIHELFRYLNTL